MMKKVLLTAILLLNLLPYFNGGRVIFSSLAAYSQDMANESSYYNCYDSEIGEYTSPLPCDEVCVTVCPICGQTVLCDDMSAHLDEHSNQEDDSGSDNADAEDDDSNSGSYGGGTSNGSGTSGGDTDGGSTTGHNYWNGNNFLYSPMTCENIIKNYKITGRWCSQLPNTSNCFLCCMEYVWNIQHSSPDYMNNCQFNGQNYYILWRTSYGFDYEQLYGKDPGTGSGVACHNETEFLTSEGFLNCRISSNEINNYIDSQHLIIYTHKTGSGNDGHATVVIGYDNQNNLILIDPWYGEIIKRPIDAEAECYAIAISPYTNNSKKHN
jgi:hypothetical protein